MTDQHHEAARRQRADDLGAAASGLRDRAHDAGTRIVHGTGSGSPGPAGASGASGASGATATGTTKHRPWWLLALIALVAVAAPLFGLSRCGNDQGRVDAPAAPAMPNAPGPDAPAANAPAPDAQAPDMPAPDGQAAAPAGAAAGALVTAGGTSVFSTAGSGDGSLAGLVGQNVSGRSVPVRSVPADEGFWVGTNDADRVWVELVGSGESAVQIKPGQLLDLSGPVVGHGRDFAAKEGVTAAEGAEQLTREAAHLEVDPNQVKIAGMR